MYQLYERVPKTKQYMQGSRLVEPGKNPFSEGPCLLCVAAAETFDKSVFGITKQGMRMARLRVRGEVNAGYDLGSFPVKFLSMKLNTRNEENRVTQQERIQDFVRTYLLPLISSNGQRIDCTQAMRQMRNVNILSYCDGTLTVQNIEESLINLMQELGYTSEEINKIQSQMCMFPIATNRLTGKQKSTCISFKDINDDEVSDDITPEIEQTINSSPICEGIFRYSNNELAYYMASNGAHTIRAYTQLGKALPVCLASVISSALKNSIDNSDKTKEFLPVTADQLVAGCKDIMHTAEQGLDLGELFDILDKSLRYKGARKLTDMEVQLLDQLDEIYDEHLRAEKELKRTRGYLDREREGLRKIDQAIQENCSDVTVKKILLARGYQFSKEERQKIEILPSDREVIGDRSADLSTQDTHTINAAKLEASVRESQRLAEEILVLEGQNEK